MVRVNEIPNVDVVIHSRSRDVEILHWQEKRMIRRTVISLFTSLLTEL